MSMTFAEKIIQALRELSLSVGGVRAACRRVGVSTNTLNNWMVAGSFLATKLDPWLDGLAVDHQRFFHYAYAPFDDGRCEALDRFGAEAVEIAFDQHRPAEQEVAQRLRLAYMRGELEVASAPTGETLARLEEIEKLRDRNVKASADQARLLAEETRNLEVAARALGLWASALRPRRQLDQAHLLLWTALRLAGAGAVEARERLEPVVGELLVRTAYLQHDRGCPEAALPIIEAAFELLSASGDPVHIARCHVDRADLYYDSGKGESAEQNYRKALRKLPPADHRYLGAAHYGLARILVATGELAEAERHACDALRFFEAGSVPAAKLCLLRGRILSARGLHEAAEVAYQLATAGLADLPGELLLASAELIRCFVRQGRPAEACASARRLVALFGQVRRDPALTSVVTDLARAGTEGEEALSLGVVNDAVERVQARLADSPGRPSRRD